MKKILLLVLFVALTVQEQPQHKVLTIRENLLHLIEKDEWFFYACSFDEPDCSTVSSFFEELSMKFPRITFGFIPSAEKNIFRYLKVDEVPSVFYAKEGLVYSFSENVGYKTLIKFLRSDNKIDSVTLLGKLTSLIDEGSVRKVHRLTLSQLGKISKGNWLVHYDGPNSMQSHFIKDGLEQAYADKRFPKDINVAIVDVGTDNGDNVKYGTDIYPSYFLYIRKNGKTLIYRGTRDLSKDGILYFLNNYETEGRLATTQLETPKSILRFVVGTALSFADYVESLFDDVSADLKVIAILFVTAMLGVGVVIGILIGFCGKRAKKGTKKDTKDTKKDDGIEEEEKESVVSSTSQPTTISKRKNASSEKTKGAK